MNKGIARPCTMTRKPETCPLRQGKERVRALSRRLFRKIRRPRRTERHLPRRLLQKRVKETPRTHQPFMNKFYLATIRIISVPILVASLVFVGIPFGPKNMSPLSVNDAQAATSIKEGTFVKNTATGNQAVFLTKVPSLMLVAACAS